MTVERPSEVFKDLVIAVAEDLKGARDALNRLDGVAGDGDLGLTVSTGALALVALAPDLVALPESEAIRRCGTEIARRAPSTGGTLIAFALLAAAKADVDPSAPPVERAARYLQAAVDSIAQRGRVAPGDRTMLDAFHPAVEAVRAAADRGADSWQAAMDAAAAADAGSRSTVTMAASVGRAGWLADRAAGHEDAGAHLVALAFAAAARYRTAVDGRNENGRADYFQWQSLFVVLDSAEAVPVAERLAPGLRIDDGLRTVAKNFVRSEAVVTTNQDADELLTRSISELETVTDREAFDRLTELGRLLEPDTSGREPHAWTWTAVLRRWATDPAGQDLEHRSIVDEVRTFPGLQEHDARAQLEPVRWQILLSYAQARLIARAVAAHLEAMSPASREALLEDARNTASAFGIPREHIPF